LRYQPRRHSRFHRTGSRSCHRRTDPSTCPVDDACIVVATRVWRTMQTTTCQWLSRAFAVPLCPSGHTLTASLTPRSGLSCDACEGLFAAGVSVHGCRNCNYDLCTFCFGS
jgi:hypothetical protein